ncbi:uncharacterized protein LOC135205752 isoform X2 [Macrobrachium nipponense]|uniref:uncharacterized protein LOC135205752 isoform X2 n=1 Tax=Macrobrachium nipponense TaxID=159736 RepID=UPI0030C81C25
MRCLQDPLHTLKSKSNGPYCGLKVADTKVKMDSDSLDIVRLFKMRHRKELTWSPASIHHLLKEVQIYPILWNCNHPHYLNMEEKYLIWDTITRNLRSAFPALAMERLTLGSVVQKFINLKSTFQREAKRLSIVSNDFENEPKWRYFQACSFMLNPGNSDPTSTSHSPNQLAIPDHLGNLEEHYNKKVCRWINDDFNVAETTEPKKEITPSTEACNLLEKVIPEVSGEHFSISYQEEQPQTSKCKETVNLVMDQEHFDEKIIVFVVDEMLPTSVVDNQKFRDIFTGVYPTLNLISKKSLEQHIIEKSTTIKNKIKDQLAKQSYICMTFDVWLSKGKSFVRVTAHWIDEEILERCSASLALKRFRGKRILEDNQISQILNDILELYSISLIKVVAIITGSTCNFENMLRDYGVHCFSRMETHGYGCEYNIDINDDVFSSYIETKMEEILPFNMRCMSRVLSVICTKDVDSALNGTIGKLHHSAFGKCSSIWKQLSSPNQANIVERILKCSPILPSASSYISLHDSIQVLVEHRTKLSDVTKVLSLPQFEDQELDYLSEYIMVLTPIAKVLKKWQRDKDCFYGCLIPTLFATEKKLKALLQSQLQYCQPILSKIIEAFTKSFDNFLHLDNSVNGAIIACASNPQFKLRWLTIKEEMNTIEHRKRVQDFLVMAVKTEISLSVEKRQKYNSNESFYYGKDHTSATDSDMAELEVSNYLHDSSNVVTSLLGSPLIKRVFLKYNTPPLTSSAPIERLFGFQGCVCALKDHNLSDEMFETFLILKGNLHYFECSS